MIKTKGGYAMVDLAHVSLSGLGVTFAGLYQKLYNKIGKPILLCNVNIGGTEYQDCYVQPVYTDEGFEMTVGDYTLTVASNSVVTATEGIVGGESGPGTLAELTDVALNDETLQGGDILIYDATEEEWVNGQPSAGATELTQLVDVGINLDTLQEGDVLTFDATQLKWTNSQPSGGPDITVVPTIRLLLDSLALPSVGDSVNITYSHISLGSGTEIPTLTPIAEGATKEMLVHSLQLNYGNQYITVGTCNMYATKSDVNLATETLKGTYTAEYSDSSSSATLKKAVASVVFNLDYNTSSRTFVSGNIRIARLA